MAVFAEFVLSAASARQFPGDGLPEIALVGRSNVGKSSMINSLLNMSKLARTSNTPGRTQTLNFYRVWPQGKPRFGDQKDPDQGDRFTLTGTALEAAVSTGAFYFVDMPGYGYARVSESQKQAWRKLIEHYLMTRSTLRGVIQIVDLRHPPSADDKVMSDWLRHYGANHLCLATKADKLPRNQRVSMRKLIGTELGLTGDGPLLYSAEEPLGRAELWDWVLQAAQHGPSQR